MHTYTQDRFVSLVYPFVCIYSCMYVVQVSWTYRNQFLQIIHPNHNIPSHSRHIQYLYVCMYVYVCVYCTVAIFNTCMYVCMCVLHSRHIEYLQSMFVSAFLHACMYVCLLQPTPHLHTCHCCHQLWPYACTRICTCI